MGDISKVINTILTLTDRMSAPLKSTSKSLKKSQEKLDELKKAQSKFKVATTMATKKVENQTIKVQELIEKHGKDSKEVAIAKKKLEEYTNSLKKAKEASTEAAKATATQVTAYKQLQNKVSSSKKILSDFSKNSVGMVDNAISKTVKVGTTLATAAGSFAIGTGFSQAFDLEGYKMQLVTATKDTEKASKLMADAVKFANSTPFETGEVVEATAKMEAYGISSEKWLADVADMAGATNKSIDQATEAMADAVVGEFERMKEFGIKKEQIIERATKLSSKAIVAGKKGEGAKRVAIEKALQQLMQEKFKGGAEAQAKTFKGMWSTISGVTKSALAKIVGMNEDGTIRTGSLYEKLKEKMQSVIEILNTWMEDGTIEKIATQVTVAVEKMIVIFSNLINFIIKYREAIKIFAIFIGIMYAVAKAIALYNAVMTIATIVTALLASPVLLVVAAIAAVVAIAYKLGILDDIFRIISKGVDIFLSVLTAIPGAIKEIFTSAFSWVTEKMEALSKKWKKFKSYFGFGDKKEENKKELDTVKKKTVIENVVSEKNDLLKKEIIPKKMIIPKITPNSTGIIPKVNTNLPKNKKEKQHIIEKTVVEKTTKPINITINGDIYGFNDFKDKVSEVLAELIKYDMQNTV